MCDKPTDFRKNATLPVGLQGRIVDDFFWIQHTQPHLLNIPQRYFEGSIKQQNGITVISGTYRFTTFYKMFASIVVLAIIIASLIRLVLDVRYPFIPLYFALPFLIGPCFSSLYFKKADTIVISFLEKITAGD